MMKSLFLCAVSLAALFGCGSDDSSGGNGGSDQGGGPSSSSAGGSGGASACAVDCATIKTPQCQQAVCDEASGQCKVVPGEEASPCDDSQFCTVGETCKAGACVGGGQNDCGMRGDPCTAIVCDEQSKTCSPSPLNDGSPCISTDPCQVNAVCQGKLCVGSPKDCTFSPEGECNAVTCNPANGKCEGSPDPSKNGQTCYQSGDLCKVQKTCSNGDCIGGVPKDCSVLSIGCDKGVCDTVDGQCFAETIPEGDPCNDGDSCTMGETCQNGVCQGGTTSGYVAYFTETFGSNAAGWTLDGEWAIGPTMVSSCLDDNQDPAMDHSPDADNGVAGIVLGGCASQAFHPFQYLTSPVIDVSAAPGSVYLEFWRFLNSDLPSYQDETIDVFDGNAWVNVWTQSTQTTDTVWTHVSYDITAYKNANMKVRFGQNVAEMDPALVYIESSWNVDDVVVANAVCN